jgi:TRAP-type C4-dicarboxylate transport system permease large subunit
VLGWSLTNAQIPPKFARAILETTSHESLVLFFLNVCFLAAGMFLHSAAAIILIVSIVIPLVRQLGIDPVHVGIIVTINLGVGQQAPPAATVLLTTSASAGLPFREVFTAGWTFTAVLALVTPVVTYFPPMSLFLVDLLFK